MATEPSELERDQIEEDIERLQLALQADDEENSSPESEDEGALQIVENKDVILDTSQAGPSHANGTFLQSTSISEIPDGEQIPGQLSNVIAIEQLPLNPETSLALNRTYQELILDSLRRIEIALAENREKQNALEEGLEDRSTSNKSKDEKSGLKKKKNMSTYAKPYFKGSMGQIPPENDDVKLKRIMKELEQNIQPPIPWSTQQRKTLQDAIKSDALKQKLTPLMNRQELYLEKISTMKSELGILEHQLKCKYEPRDGEVKEENESLHDLETDIEEKKLELKEMENKVSKLEQQMKDFKHIPTVDLLSNVDFDCIDWLMIANSVMDGKRTVTECQKMWKNVLHPSINKERWSAEEICNLQVLVDKYQMSNWPAIAKELKTNRTPFQCLQYYQQNLNDAYSKRKWTKEEDEMLQEVIENCQIGNRISWSQVSYFLDGRSPFQCQQRWTTIDPSVKRGKWSTEEDCRLLTAVQLHNAKNWNIIKEYVPNRTTSQCRDRYMNALNPNLRPPHMWTYEEDKELLTLINKDLEENGRISWVKIAHNMAGRTDNSILTRYKRLMLWKEKCEWIDQQPESEREAMGLLNIPKTTAGTIKSDTQRKREALITNKALGLAEQNEGIQASDYLKQLEDKIKGRLVVPRPPLLCRYSTRSFQHVWDRKKHLHDMIQVHLANELSKVTTPKERATLPEKTTEDLKPLITLTKEQEENLKALLREKGPGEITVREILDMSRKASHVSVCMKKRKDRYRADLFYDNKIREILMWKRYYSVYRQQRRGRPKKLFIFDPDEIEDEEKVEKVRDITMNLLMNALEVNSKEAMTAYNSTTESRKQEIPEEDIQFLRRIISKRKRQTASTTNPVQENMHESGEKVQDAGERGQEAGRVQSNSDTQGISESSQKGGRVLSNADTQNAGEKSQEAGRVPSNTDKQGITEKGQEAGRVPSNTDKQDINEKGQEAGRVLSNTDTQGISEKGQEAGGVQFNADTQNVGEKSQEAGRIQSYPDVQEINESGQFEVVHANSEVVVSVENQNSVQVNAEVLEQRNTNQTENLEQDGVKLDQPGQEQEESKRVSFVLPINNPQSEGPNAEEPMKDPDKMNMFADVKTKAKVLPPCRTTMRGLEGLLLHKKFLRTRAGNLYNKNTYKNKSRLLQLRLRSLQIGADIVDLQKRVQDGLDSAMHLSSTLSEAENSKKSKTILRTKEKLKRTNLKPSAEDPLLTIRHTEAFKKLRQRFQSLFVWPALLSTIPPTEANEADADYVRFVSTRAKQGRKLLKLSGTQATTSVVVTSQTDGMLKKQRCRIGKVGNLHKRRNPNRGMKQGNDGNPKPGLPKTDIKRPRKNYKELLEQRSSNRVALKRKYDDQMEVEKKAELVIKEEDASPKKQLRGMRKWNKIKKSTYEDSMKEMKLVRQKTEKEEVDEDDEMMSPGGLPIATNLDIMGIQSLSSTVAAQGLISLQNVIPTSGASTSMEAQSLISLQNAVEASGACVRKTPQGGVCLQNAVETSGISTVAQSMITVPNMTPSIPMTTETSGLINIQAPDGMVAVMVIPNDLMPTTHLNSSTNNVSPQNINMVDPEVLASLKILQPKSEKENKQ